MPSKKRVVHLIITNLIRFILFLTFIYAITSNRTLVQTISAIAFVITFIPTILNKIFNIQIPASAEILYLMFVYGLLILGEQRGFYHGLWWWDILMTFTASLALGFTALSIIHVLHKTNRINTNPFLAAILIFSLTLSLATLWEVFEFTLDTLISSGLQASLIDTMQDISINVLGAVLISIAGYTSLKKGNSIFASTFLTSLIEKTPLLLGPKRKEKDPKKIAQEIIQIGETSKIEFKSTLRTNLHTNQPDKKMELAVIKTIAAFLNTKGGNLIVGISDDKSILGLELDGFQNDDKINLHLTNLIKSHIGNEFLPFIKTAIVEIENKKILLILCRESKKRVFLKSDNKEEFYIRNGPASVKLEGNALIDYINHKFQS
ncbi:ATP-binding protein [Candidatus Pacearchaeota archaeon]|nr:ATP-binding protein [Candidatus Pacearchaeota archaeon]